MQNYKHLFPIFKKSASRRTDLVYLDSGATALKPQMVLDKMMEYYSEYSANIHRGLYPISERATVEYEKVREKVAKFIGAEKETEIIFTSGTTASVNLVARGWGEVNLKEGDEIVVSEIEHHSNLVPWQQLARRLKLNIKYIPYENEKLLITNYELLITKRTKLLALTHVSNVLGQINPIKEIVKKAREINPGICVVVDGAQAVPHIPVNVTDLDVDFYAFSGHKLYGPTGVGVLYTKAKRQMQMNPDNFGGGMIKMVTLEESTWASGPEKFEAGTPPIAEVIGLGTAIDFVNSIGFEEIQNHERELIKYLLDKLREIDWIEVLGSVETENRLGVVSLFSRKLGMGTSHDIADILGRDFNVCTRAGHHCAMPLHEKNDLLTGTVRVSLGIYNDKSDIDRLILGLSKIEKIFNHLTI
ncbi:SufS family cysteine desulfurase [Candidatus Shapirobacteria bacterium]|nr:SufS family cysteine desulfurase [Candidatus Shapirobacteria bacterium]